MAILEAIVFDELEVASLSDIIVDRWKQQGVICCWKSDGKWNLTADDNGCLALIDLINRMNAATWGSKKEIKISSVQVLANDHPGSKPRFASSLIIKCIKGNECADHWRLEERDAHLYLEVGNYWLTELLNVAHDIKNGGGDYHIGKKPSLWVWWYVNQ